jgi:hypothetical protein
MNIIAVKINKQELWRYKQRLTTHSRAKYDGLWLPNCGWNIDSRAMLIACGNATEYEGEEDR